MPRTILHVDFDSFFASCEQHFNPNLRGKPIGVTAENGRNCVIAASREAKRLGIKSPNTTWEAKRICPEIILVKADFERYLEITKKLIEISCIYSPLVEMFSLDEVFIDLTCVTNLYPNPIMIVEDFKRRLREEIGMAVTASMGVSYNKILAKLATGLNKPDGYALIDSSNKEKIMANLELTDIMGIGNRFKHRLNMMGIYKFAELAECPLHLLRAEFGKVAAENLKALSLGIDDSPVVSYLEETETKSVGRNYCLPENTYDRETSLKTIYELCEEIAIKLRRLKMKTRTIGLFLHGNESFGQRYTIGHYTNLSAEIFDICSKFYKKWKPEYIRQVSIWAGNLIDEQFITLPLFENEKKDKVTDVIDKINDRFGHHTIRNGYLTYAPQLHTKPNGYGADRAMRKEIAGLG